MTRSETQEEALEAVAKRRSGEALLRDVFEAGFCAGNERGYSTGRLGRAVTEQQVREDLMCRESAFQQCLEGLLARGLCVSSLRRREWDAQGHNEGCAVESADYVDGWNEALDAVEALFTLNEVP